MPTKILIVTGDAAESLEVLYPYQRLLEEGYEVHIAAPTHKTLRFVVHDFEPGYDTYTEKPGYTWPADLAFSEVDAGDYAALVIPGGRAPRVSAQRRRTPQDPQGLLRRGQAGRADLPRPAAHRRDRLPAGPPGHGLPRAGAGHAGRRAGFQDTEAVVDGTLSLVPRLAGPSGLDARVLEGAAHEGTGELKPGHDRRLAAAGRRLGGATGAESRARSPSRCGGAVGGAVGRRGLKAGARSPFRCGGAAARWGDGG